MQLKSLSKFVQLLFGIPKGVTTLKLGNVDPNILQEALLSAYHAVFLSTIHKKKN